MSAASTKLVRLALYLVVVGLCLGQLAAGFKMPGKREKTQEEKEEEERLKLAKDAYKRLFVRSGKLKREEVLQKLMAMDHYYDNEDYDMPIDVRQLMAYNVSDESKCDDRDYILGLKALVKRTKSQYTALHSYLSECLQEQLALCHFEDRFKHKVAMFQEHQAAKWNLIRDFNYAASQHGIREHDWKGKLIDNSYQMNDALSSMFEEKIRSGEYQGHEISIKAYNLANELKEACQAFNRELGSSLRMTTFNSKIKQNEDMLEWLRYLNVCEQVERVNFQQALTKMFHQQVLPGADEWWNSYLDYRQNWNL